MLCVRVPLRVCAVADGPSTAQLPWEPPRPQHIGALVSRYPVAGSQHEVMVLAGGTGRGALARGPGAQLPHRGEGALSGGFEQDGPPGPASAPGPIGGREGSQGAVGVSEEAARCIGRPVRLASQQGGSVTTEGFLHVQSLFSWGAFPAHTFGTSTFTCDSMDSRKSYLLSADFAFSFAARIG